MQYTLVIRRQGGKVALCLSTMGGHNEADGNGDDSMYAWQLGVI